MMPDIQERASGGLQTLAGKYLTFALHNESYGIDVLQTREIIRMRTVTAMPQMPQAVRGVINLRGKIIAVVDLRLRFGLGEVQQSNETCIIVVELRLPGGRSTQAGLIVDAVDEVLNIAAGDIEAPPDIGCVVARDYILGIAKLNGAIKTLLNIDRVVTATELKEVAKESG